MNKVWIIDDDRSIRWVLEKALEQENIESLSFENGDKVLNALNREIPDAIISDVRMPGIDGLSLLQKIHDVQPDIPVIIMTAHSDLDSAVNSYQKGAFEYLPKPFDVDEAVDLMKRAINHKQESAAANDALSDQEYQNTEIIGEAPAMQEVFRAIGRLSHSNITV
ncbi:nitrogen regulation protein NR(I), partial [Bermanella sp. 47_1433_sub80_T6]